MLGPEAVEIIFPPSTDMWKEWPTETESLIRERFLRDFQHGLVWSLKEACSRRFVRFAKDPNNARIIFFVIADGPHCTRLFVSINNGKSWQELTPIRGMAWSAAITSRGNKLTLFVGGRLGGSLLRYTVLELDQLRESGKMAKID
ncbi:MAG: hypothetical protein DDT33_01755 [Firmicutes bacterium]|nr:hypothetical protein [Bacillota bacterium]